MIIVAINIIRIKLKVCSVEMPNATYSVVVNNCKNPFKNKKL